MSKENFVVCLSTIDSMRLAKKISRELVEKKIVACVNIIPKVLSVYRWKGEICEENEILLLMKTKRSLVKKLEGKLKPLHPYEVPEFIVLSVKSGTKEYLKWLKTAVSGLH